MAIATPPQSTEGLKAAPPPLEPPDGPSGTPPPQRPPDEAWRQWMMMGIGLVGVGSILAVIVSLVALTSHNPTNVITPASASASAAPAATQAVSLTVKADTEHGKRGSDGQWHDAFLPGDFTVKAGARVTVTVLNYDSMPHSFTSSTLSPSELVNTMIPAGSASAPSKTTFTFTASSTPGKYAWWCAIPCDPWSMSHDGFMRGYVTVVA